VIRGLVAASWTKKSFRPFHLKQPLSAGFFGSEFPLEAYQIHLCIGLGDHGISLKSFLEQEYPSFADLRQ